MREILLNDEIAYGMVPGPGGGSWPAYEVHAAMFGPYTKPKVRIDYSFPVFMIGVLLALSDNIAVSSLGCVLAGYGMGMIGKKVSE